MSPLERKYLMRLTARQTVDGESDTLFMETTAAMTGTPARYELRYRDEGGDMHGTRNVLRVERGKSVTLFRDGEYATHLIVEQGVRHLSQYATPYGMLMLGVCGLSLVSDVSDAGGTLRFRYCTDVELTPVGEFDFEIKLTAAPTRGQTEESI